MKKGIFFVFVFACFGSSFLCAQTDQAAAVSSFQALVKQVDDFFSTSQTVLITEDYEKPTIFDRASKTGKLNYLLRFEKLGIAYDVQKTDSLISPFTAYIVLRLRASANGDSGTLPGHEPKGSMGWGKAKHWGWDTPEEAQKGTEF
jgi:hypothetical protein